MNLEIYGNAKDGFHASGDSTDEVFEPCPFCDSDEVKVGNTHSPSYWAECRNCGAQGPHNIPPKRYAKSRAGVRKQHIATFNEAVRLWNERTIQD